MFRGAVPTDRPAKEIAYNSLADSDDMWEHLACALGDKVEIVYWGGSRHKEYAHGKCVRWVKSLKDYKPLHRPNIIFNRGGFEEPANFIKGDFGVYKIYYGAGKRIIPKDGVKYDLVLVDSEKQLERARKKGLPAHLWTKPCAENIFYPRYVKKEFDVCFVANGQQADIKQVKWVYETIPKGLTCLHLGLKSKYKTPKNIFRERSLRKDMAAQMSRCRVGIVPYKAIDSAPRVISEMHAVGLPVLALVTVNFNNNSYYTFRYDKKDFWPGVKKVLLSGRFAKKGPIAKFYKDHLSMDCCAMRLKKLINEDCSS